MPAGDADSQVSPILTGEVSARFQAARPLVLRRNPYRFQPRLRLLKCSSTALTSDWVESTMVDG
jgi:hypothetical protein